MCILRQILRTHGKGGASGEPWVPGIWNILFSLVWLWFLTILCNRGYVTLAWVLVLLPFIIGAIIIILLVSVLASIPAGGTVITPTREVTPVTPPPAAT